MRCRTCGYDLRGLPEHRCPECGRAFDPLRPITFLTQPVSGIAMLWGAVLAVFLILLPLIIAKTQFADFVPMILVPFGPASMIIGAAMGGVIARRCWQVVRNHEPWIVGRWAIWPAMLIGGGAFALFVLATLGSIVFHYFF